MTFGTEYDIQFMPLKGIRTDPPTEKPMDICHLLSLSSKLKFTIHLRNI